MSSFPLSFEIVWDGQAYRPVAVCDHVKIDGTQTKLVEWRSDCPSCGCEFAVMTGLAFTSPRRRCDACKAPGRSVKADRKRFVKQIKGEIP